MRHTDLEDDPSIRDDCELLRGIPIKLEINIIWDDNQKRWRPSSVSFKDRRNGTPKSIVLRDDLGKAGRSPAEVLTGHKDFALATVTAGIARESQQHVARDPLPDEPAHGLVIGEKKKASKIMAKASQWVIAPTNME